MRLSVAAAMIVRDEAHVLPHCLASMAGLLDEIVIVDTGSRDATCAIAEAAGAKLIHHTWQGDFALARNIALDAVSSDWVLYIDADERLALPEGGRLADYLDAGSLAAYVRFRPKSGYTRYREIRTFRSRPDIRYAGKIHETVNPAIFALAGRGIGKVVQSAIKIDHFGYDGDQTHKHGRNLPLLEAAVLDDPDRVYYWYHLAETLLAIGEAGRAEAAARQGLAAAQRAPSSKQAADASLIYQILARQGLAGGQDVLELMDAGLRQMPQDHALHFLRGQFSLAAGEAHLALAIALNLLTTDAAGLEDGLLAFDARIFGEKACELAALACLQLGERHRAAGFFQQAAALAPDEMAYRVKAAALGRQPMGGAGA